MEQKKKKTIELNACFGDVAQKCERNFVEVLINSRLQFFDLYDIIKKSLQDNCLLTAWEVIPTEWSIKERSGARHLSADAANKIINRCTVKDG